MGVHYFAESAERTIGSIANVCKPDAISGHRISACGREAPTCSPRPVTQPAEPRATSQGRLTLPSLALPVTGHSKRQEPSFAIGTTLRATDRQPKHSWQSVLKRLLGVGILTWRPSINDVIHEPHQHAAADDVAQYYRHQVVEETNPSNGIGGHRDVLEGLQQHGDWD
jgi:hypothetical protein